MKRNHIAIAGILASVLVTMDTAWADTGTVIASQAYVDAKVGTKLNSSALNAGTLSTTSTTTVPSEKTVSDAITSKVSTKLNSSALNAGTLSTTSTTTVPSEKTVNDAITTAVSGIDLSAPAATTYVTTGTNALSLAASTAKAPSITAVQGMKSTASLATVSNGTVSISAGSDTSLPTTKAVADTIKALDHKTASASSNAATAVTAVSQADGQVTVTNGTLAAAAIGQKVTNDLLSSTNTGYIPTVAALQGAVSYVNNTASEITHTATVNVSTVPAANDVFTRNTTIAAKGDDYVPTVAAVEARVKAAESLIPTVPGGTSTKSATYDTTAHTLTVATSGDGASTSKHATSKQVANTITDVKSYIDYKDGLKVDANTAITASGTTNKIVQYDAKGLVVAGTNAGALATLDAVGSAQITDGSIVAADLASNAVTAAKIASSAVTNAKLGADAVTNAKLADDAVQTENIKDGTILNADISNTAAIAYTKMDGTLKDVNSTSADATCSAASPCVLTYYKIGSTVYYKWTNLIETDGVTALPAS